MVPTAMQSSRLVVQKSVLSALCCFAVATALLWITLLRIDRPTEAVVWGGLALAVWAFGLFCLIGAGQGALLGLGRWRLGPWIMLWYCVAYGLATVTWSHPQTGVVAQIAVVNVLRALWLVAVGITFWTIGYFAGAAPPMRGVARRAVAATDRRFTADLRSPMTPWVLYVLGTAARVVHLITTGAYDSFGTATIAPSASPSATQQIVNLISFFGTFGVAAAAMRGFSVRKPGAWLTLAILFSLDLGFDTLTGAKGNFELTFLAVLIPFGAAKGKFPIGMVAAFVVVALAVIVPFTVAYRNLPAASGQTSVSRAISAAPGQVQDAAASDQASQMNVFTYTLQRMREIDNPAIILQRTPSTIPFTSPLGLIEDPFIGSIPRLIWPGKPAIIAGLNMSQQYYGLPPTLYTNSAPTPAGDLYRYGGWAPVIAGMFVLGLAVRVLDDIVDVRVNSHSIFPILVCFQLLVPSEQGWSTLMSGIPSELLIIFLAWSLTFKRRRYLRPDPAHDEFSGDSIQRNQPTVAPQ